MLGSVPESGNVRFRKIASMFNPSDVANIELARQTLTKV